MFGEGSVLCDVCFKRDLQMSFSYTCGLKGLMCAVISQAFKLQLDKSFSLQCVYPEDVIVQLLPVALEQENGQLDPWRLAGATLKATAKVPRPWKQVRGNKYVITSID